jgi:hypothetical protein
MILKNRGVDIRRKLITLVKSPEQVDVPPKHMEAGEINSWPNSPKLESPKSIRPTMSAQKGGISLMIRKRLKSPGWVFSTRTFQSGCEYDPRTSANENILFRQFLTYPQAYRPHSSHISVAIHHWVGDRYCEYAREQEAKTRGVYHSSPHG